MLTQINEFGLYDNKGKKLSNTEDNIESIKPGIRKKSNFVIATKRWYNRYDK